MTFTKDEINEFKEIFEKSYKKRLTFDMAERLAYYLYNMHKVLYDIVEKKAKINLQKESINHKLEKRDKEGNLVKLPSVCE